MKNLLVLSFLVLGACGKSPDGVRYANGGQVIHPEFVPYVAVYEAAKGSKINDRIVMAFESLPVAVGECRMYGTGELVIVIDSTKWDSYSKERRLQLVLHELGHCDLGREHDDTVINGEQKSVMHKYVFPVMRVRAEYYLNELLGKQADLTSFKNQDEKIVIKD